MKKHNQILEHKIRQQLLALADCKHQKFVSALIPDCSNVLGVRIPQIRQIAKELTKECPLEYINETQEIYCEEIMIKGLIIANLKADLSTILKLTAIHIKKINNWANCDNFCSAFKIARQYPDEVWQFLQPYWHSNETYKIRVAVVIMLSYYINEKYLPELFKVFDYIQHSDYYVKMAVAWAVSFCYIKFPKQTMEYLLHNRLDDFTFNKSLQKIVESYRVTAEDKAKIRTLKRK